jgi:hypothetical protein
MHSSNIIFFGRTIKSIINASIAEGSLEGQGQGGWLDHFKHTVSIWVVSFRIFLQLLLKSLKKGECGCRGSAF